VFAAALNPQEADCVTRDWRDGGWTAIVPSVNDYAHMREITAREAEQLMAA
jgi:hypothetical protein